MAEQDEWVVKSLQSLGGAESEVANLRYDNAVNRAYYACFQAAVAALLNAGEKPATGQGTRSHAVIQASFVRELIRRRKLYPASLASILPDLYAIRQQADYTTVAVSDIRCRRAVEKARSFVAEVQKRLEVK